MTVRPGKICVFIGTRPELIKLAPVIRALKALPDAPWRLVTVFTGQHEELVAQAADVFAIVPDRQLHIARQDDSLAHLTARLLVAVNGLMAQEEPDLVVVQGDTTTVLCAALAAFYRRVAIAHVEAGLHTHDLSQPFPEEANRALVARLASLDFAPTEPARQALMAEGIADETISVTGNTVIDAVMDIAAKAPRPGVLARHGVPASGGPIILVTMHRRESWDRGIASACRALKQLSNERPGLRIVLPVHPGATVRQRVMSELANHAGVFLLPPLDYRSFLAIATEARLFLSDSGGLQEEGAALHKPVLVLREKNERGEAIEAGTARLVGTDSAGIVAEVNRLLDDAEDYLPPHELNVFNYFIPFRDVVQLPVFPMDAGWGEFTSGHYMDEFAQMHLKDMPGWYGTASGS